MGKLFMPTNYHIVVFLMDTGKDVSLPVQENPSIDALTSNSLKTHCYLFSFAYQPALFYVVPNFLYSNIGKKIVSWNYII